MPRPKAKLLVPSLLAALAFGVSACGGSGSELLAGTTASEINSNLDRVPGLVAEGNCEGAEEAVSAIEAQVSGLEGVNGELKQALNDAASHLSDVVAPCEEAPEEATEEFEPEEPEETEEKKQKPEKQTEPDEFEEEREGNNGKGKGKGPPAVPPGQDEETEGTTSESETESGGVGPSSPVGGEE